MSDWKEGHLYINEEGGHCPILKTDDGYLLMHDNSPYHSTNWNPAGSSGIWVDMGNFSRYLHNKLGDYFV